MAQRTDTAEQGYHLLCAQRTAGTQASNDCDFSLKPLTIAVDELADELTAANGAPVDEFAEAAVQLSDDALVAWIYQTAKAPPDLPHPMDVVTGVAHCIQSLRAWVPETAALAGALNGLRCSKALGLATGIRQRRPLAGRRKRYPEWDLCLAASKRSAPDPDLPAAILGAALLRAHLLGEAVHGGLLNRLNVGLHDNVQTKPGRWTRSAQQKTLQTLIEQLRAAIRQNHSGAVQLGLRERLEEASPKPLNSIEAFNRALQKRWRAVADYLSPRGRQAVVGHGTLTPNLALTCGASMRRGAEAGDRLQVLMLLEGLLNLPQQMIHGIPVCDSEDPGPWIRLSVTRNAIGVDLEWILADGARPHAGTESLYEPTTRFYWIPLPPWACCVLQSTMNALQRPASTAGELLGYARHHPKAPVLPHQGAYTLTLHRFRQTLPHLALSDGAPRMVAALLLCQFGIVSPGRPFYGAVTSRALDAACAHLYRRLGWLGRREQVGQASWKIGSLVVPSDAGLKAVFGSLARSVEDAGREHVEEPTEDSWIARHQSAVAYFGAAAELDLCLRRSEAYRLSPLEMGTGPRVHVDDKHVHNLGGGPAQGKSTSFIQLIEAFTAYLRSASSEPCLQRSDRGVRIRLACAQASSALAESELMIDFDGNGSVVSVGSSTWLSKLPPHLKLVENFGRHYWPSRMQVAGLLQRHLDYLLRHRLHGWEHQTGHDFQAGDAVRAELIEFLDGHMKQLALPVPQLLRREEKE